MVHYKKYCLNLLMLVLLVVSQTVHGQLLFKNHQNSKSPVVVKDETKKTFAFPWAGGMNSCQFNEIDLDLDGTKDLMVFDRNGNRIMTFLNGGTAGQVDYTYAPEYAQKFPGLFDWVILADYNMDGKNDIFTYSPGWAGMKVYKNTSGPELEFTVEVEPFLTSLQGGGYVNILVTYADYPGISDIDNDGDLDILVFWGLGSFVEMHKNMSMEKYGIADSLDFEETTSCWGHFAENDESNEIYLDTCNNIKQMQDNKTNRHTGSTFLLLDLDNDADKDLLLGDVDYPNLVELINGGDTDEAHMTSYDTLFPVYDKPLKLFSMPAGMYIDIDNDEVKDLIVSPFDPSTITSRNKRSVQLYRNEGANEFPDFAFAQNDFLQEDMIDVGSGSCPLLFDYNNDGLQDLFISNFGYYMYSYYQAGAFLKSVYWSNVALFKNTGTQSEPEFTRITDNFADLHSEHLRGLYPTFGDLDNDGDTDMLAGQEDGSLLFLENVATNPDTMLFASPVFNYQDIDVGQFSAPQLIDLNQDNLPDLAIGKQDGRISYYENQGTLSSPQFIWISDYMGSVNVTDSTLSYTGYSTPRFFRNNENQLELLVGSEDGKVFYYKNIEGNLTGNFTESDSLYLLVGNGVFEMDMGMRSAAAISDMDNDGWQDLITGNYSGGLNYFSGSAFPGVNALNKTNKNNFNITVFPNPVSDILNVQVSGFDENDKIKIEVSDIFGRLEFSILSNGESTFKIQMQDFRQGIYFLKVSSFENPEIGAYQKIVVSR
ncbi:MAG: T9SS type A sorting domain-containing protein [Chlorobi bacterium]|nr:T9SS type A sorting domain-containing protein [Chlorobiota bacterium]